MGQAPFPAWHCWDRRFALLFVLAAWAAVVIGFYSAVAARWHGGADYPAPLVLQVHVFAVTGWLLLLSLQVVLIRMARISWHRALGAAGLALIPIIAFTAIGAEVDSQRFYSPQFPENLRFFSAPLLSVTVFVLAASGGLLSRKHPPAHKRLMLVATSMLLVAAYNRWWGDPIYAWLGDDFLGTWVRNFAGPNLLFAVLVAYDLVTRRRVHRVLAVGIPAIVLGELLAAFVYHADWWPPVVRGLVGL